MKFGPSGNSDSYYLAGYTSTLDAPAWIKAMGLDIFEYSFGRGVRIGKEHATEIGMEASKHGIEISVHSPYYINLASDNDETVINSFGYLMKSIEALRYFGGKRVVVHPGSPLKQDRADALNRMLVNFEAFANMLADSAISDVIICPETMGKLNQMGTLDEILKICSISEMYIPCIDFGHINSRYQGYFKSSDDYRKVFDEIFSAIGEERGRQIHIHFSNIEYGQAGEIRHLTSDDKLFGPFFEHLAPVLIEYGITGRLLSESNGTQAEDARKMKTIYEELREARY